jgi:hypothetical protein
MIRTICKNNDTRDFAKESLVLKTKKAPANFKNFNYVKTQLKQKRENENFSCKLYSKFYNSIQVVYF